MSLRRRRLDESQRAMAGVRIDTGPVTHSTPWEDVRPDRKFLILGAWQQFFHVDVKYDCRELLRIVEDMRANEAWAALGYADLDDLLRRGIEIDPELVGWAGEGLRTLDPEAPHTLGEAVEEGRRRAAEKMAATPAAGPKLSPAAYGAMGGRGRKADADGNGFKRPVGSNSTSYLAARLKRDHPEIAAAVEQGEYKSIRAAAREAGIIRDPTGYDLLRRAWNRASDHDRSRFETGIVGPSTRVERICRDWREATEDERLVFVAEHADALRLMLEHGPQEVPPAPREAPLAPVEASIRPRPSCASARSEDLPQAAPNQTPDEEGETNAA